uniref:Kinesin motor domain-containing protein n=1 Tax=Parascaris equorum TaxID=6256 RepID=A0A914RJU5_PAREQ
MENMTKSLLANRVYDGMSRTEDIYNESVIDVVKSAMAGYNGTVFAYGQTASGKTYTIFGDRHSDGVVQMAVDTIFSTIESVCSIFDMLFNPRFTWERLAEAKNL